MKDVMRDRAVHIISLGCPRNQVDSEVMLGFLVARGFGIAATPDDADTVIINTCTFIDEATQESLDTILEVAELKRAGLCRLVIAAGCLAQRYGPALAREIPEVDFWIGTEQFPRIGQWLEKEPADLERVAIQRTGFIYDHTTPRLLSGPPGSAYVKIGEGCSRRCSFCVIPSLRGEARSRSIESIEREASVLADQGIREINLVAQDVTSYGLDLQDGTNLTRLLDRLRRIEKLTWIRLLYAYPDGVSLELLRQIRESERLCNYLDVPIQHIDEHVLHRMGRSARRGYIERLVGIIRKEIPGVYLRTTLMVGFPGETEAQFSELSDFVQRVCFDRLGVFQFSPQEGTRAARMRHQVPTHVKRRRFDRLMTAQQEISLRRHKHLVGKKVVVLVEGRDPRDGVMKGRMESQAPDVDGQVTIIGPDVSPGDMVRVRVTRAHPYDLEAELLEE
jgi:ribosomal protein S12 methylthiotransferase